jgi:ribosomal protein S18 acetylase RimI-like enzyme
MQVRPARAADLDALARMWFDAWQDSHRALMPEGLIRFRTLESFHARLAAALVDTRIVDLDGAPAGFCITKGDELYQLFLAKAARGTGVAPALLKDGEARLHAAGVTTAWLSCAIGNDRAARFYEKQGWRNVGAETYYAETSEGAFALENWRFEKAL